MLFTVTYRSKTGAKAEVEIEAASRAACMAECKRKGIAPVGIREGRASSRPRAAETAASHDGRAGARPSPKRGLYIAVAVLFAAVLGGGLWWWLGREDARHPEPKAAKTIKDVKDVKGPNATKAIPTAPVVTNAPTVSTNKPQAPNPAEPMHMGRRIVGISATTNADGTVVERIRTDDGKLHSKVYSVADSVLPTRTDQLLAMAVDGDGNGPPMPGVTKDDEKRFLESLKRPIEILDTDTPDVRALKEKVMQAREDMVTLLSQGRGFAEVLAEHRKMQEENADVRREVAAELRSLVESGHTADALEYRKRMNAALEQMGIKPLTTAITEEERAERKERRRASRKERLGQ